MSTKTEAMSPAKLLDRMRAQAAQYRCNSGNFTVGELAAQTDQDRTAVAALIERNAELERQNDEILSRNVDLDKAMGTMEAERDALAELHAAVVKNGGWDDGCFYYAGRSAPELERALTGVDKARAEASNV
jgi:hypothetical protein